MYHEANYRLSGWKQFQPQLLLHCPNETFWICNGCIELKFSRQLEDTLNYDIRILGRRGVLVLNAIATMDQLPEIEQQTPQILAMVNFNDGNRYADFNPKVDKVATYGIAALVAGGVAAKLGLFKLVWVFLLAAKKFVIIAVVAVTAWIKKLFSRNNTPTPPPPSVPPPPPTLSA
jgi:uncharacterized membrane-anchored protein